VQITVKLGPDASSDRDMSLFRSVEEMGVTFAPLHPDSPDRELASYFRVEVPEGIDVEQVLDVLRSSPAVEAAYLKPADELP
jgi:hypothetical protein